MEFSFKPSIQISPGLPHATFFSITVGFESFRFSGCQPRCLFLLWEFPAPKHVVSFCICKRPLFLPGLFFRNSSIFRSGPSEFLNDSKNPKKNIPSSSSRCLGCFSPLFPSEVGLGTGGTEVPPGLPPSFLRSRRSLRLARRSDAVSQLFAGRCLRRASRWSPQGAPGGVLMACKDPVSQLIRFQHRSQIHGTSLLVRRSVPAPRVMQPPRNW